MTVCPYIWSKAGGEQKKDDYLTKNPSGLVPLLELADDTLYFAIDGDFRVP